MNPFKQLRILVPLIISLIILALLWRGLSLHPNQIPSPLINKPAPTFRLPNLLSTKNNVNNKIFLNHITLFNVWATWCSACAEEHDELLRLAAQEKIIFIGLNYKDNTKNAKQWLKENGNPYQAIAVDEAGNTAIDWGVYGAPETFIIDKKGLIRYKKVGPITAESWQRELKPWIEKLNNEPI